METPKSGIMPASTATGGGQGGSVERTQKVVFLNALVTRSDKPCVITTRPTNLEEVKSLLGSEVRIESYIGHPATSQLLTNLVGREIPTSRGMYTPQTNDLAVIVRLKKRLEKPEDVKEVKLADIEFLVALYEVKP
jgi:hypothetical protein